MYVMSLKTSDSPTCDKSCEFGVFNLCPWLLKAKASNTMQFSLNERVESILTQKITTKLKSAIFQDFLTNV